MQFVCCFAIICFVFNLGHFANGRIYTRCEVAVEMFNNGFPKSELPDWVCLVNSESSFNSSAIGGPNKNGSRDWGLFQINDHIWCIDGHQGNGCNMNCRDFVTNEEMYEDLECVKKIYGIQGFDAWHGWTKKCKGQFLRGVEDCFPNKKQLL